MAWRIACSPIPSNFTAKDISDELRELLSSALFMGPIGRLTDSGARNWSRHGDHGRTSLGAVLRSSRDAGEPAAWARFNPSPSDGQYLLRRESGCADLVVAILLDGEHRSDRLPMSLVEWHGMFTSWLEITHEVDSYLIGRLGVARVPQPAPRIGIALTAKPDLTAVVNIGDASQIEGTNTSSHFLASATLDESGVSEFGLANQWLTSLCEDSLHLDDYDLPRSRL